MREVKQYEHASREMSQRGHVEDSQNLKAGRLLHGVAVQHVRMVHPVETLLKWEIVTQGKVRQAICCHLSKWILSHIPDAGVTYHCSAWVWGGMQQLHQVQEGQEAAEPIA